MSDETLLTDLCAICHVNAIKYTCPRCGTHTCSLPCVKKHKAWAQCSGIRNPAEYRKRSELATASSIDKDFNFITNVERSIARADQEVLDRGINLAPARHLRPVDHRPKVEIEIEERGIKVIKAPKGLSRSKQNKTHWNTQQKCIMWSVEWISPDGAKNIGPALESKTIGDVYVSTVGKKKIKRKRRHSQPEDAPVQGGARRDSEGVTSQDAATQTQQAPEKAASNDETLLDGLHFYLHKPMTSSKFKCLIPVSKTQTVKSVLEGHTVLEFPTVYVKTEDSDHLTEPFISADEYSKRYGADIPVNVTTALEDGEIGDDHEPSVSGTVDSRKVMEVLARDLAA